MAQYYYLVATLPTLSSDANQFMSTQSFLQLCLAWVSKRDLALIEGTILLLEAVSSEDADPVANSILRRWQAYELRLRNELVRQRAQQLKRDAAPYLRNLASDNAVHNDERLVPAVRNAMQESNPLIAEQMLNAIRWRYLDELERDYFFSVEVLQVYYLRLQLLERTAQFRVKQGEARFQEAYAAAAKQLQGVAAIQI